MEEKECVANIITCVQQNDAKNEIAKQTLPTAQWDKIR